MAGSYRNAFCLYLCLFTVAAHVFLSGRHSLGIIALVATWLWAAVWIRFGGVR